MRTVFVTGGSGAVGRALVARLALAGDRVIALARSRTAAGVVEEAGAEPVIGDLAEAGAWTHDVAEADLVVHLGLPRLRPPVRRTRVGGLVKEAATAAATLRAAAGGTPVVMGSSALAGMDGGVPLLARPALAAEGVLAGPQLRVVRFGWVYGNQGILADLVTGLAMRRVRVVGPGDNRWRLVSAPDAAAALIAAAVSPPGFYAAAEPDAPTQVEVIHAACRALGVVRPDHLPPRLAGLAMGGPLAEALLTSMQADASRLEAQGWEPANMWRDDLVPLCVTPSPPPQAE